MLDAGFDGRVGMALRRQQLFDHAGGSFYLDRIFDCFFGNADTLFAKRFQHVRLSDAARADLSGYLGPDLVEKSESQERLQVASDLGLAVGVARSRLNVIEEIIFAQTAIADDVDVFDHARRWLLRTGMRREKQKGAENKAQNSEPDDAIKVHKCRFPLRSLWGLHTANRKLSAYFRKNRNTNPARLRC